jgi:hypothetical protein
MRSLSVAIVLSGFASSALAECETGTPDRAIEYGISSVAYVMEFVRPHRKSQSIIGANVVSCMDDEHRCESGELKWCCPNDIPCFGDDGAPNDDCHQ